MMSIPSSARTLLAILSTPAMKNHVRRRLADTVSGVTLEVATDACAHLLSQTKKEFCVNDIMATGDPDLVEDPFYAAN